MNTHQQQEEAGTRNLIIIIRQAEITLLKIKAMACVTLPMVVDHRQEEVPSRDQIKQCTQRDLSS